MVNVNCLKRTAVLVSWHRSCVIMHELCSLALVTAVHQKSVVARWGLARP